MILVRSGQPRTGSHAYRCRGVYWYKTTSISYLIFLLLLLHLVPWSLSCTPTERSYLLEFLSSLSSTYPPKGPAFPLWDAVKDPDCCLWDGISCDGLGSVTRLSIPLRGLKGPISAAALLGLPSLTHVNLSRNSLTGGLEPKLLWSASLVEFDVSFNRLDGQVFLTDPKLPREAERQQPLRLQTLDLSSNFFSGPLPHSDWWTSAPYLVALNASNNDFSGHIPSSICSVRTQLQALDLSFNNLGGEIPQGFGNCSQLRVLRIGNNDLQGQIPFELYKTVSLQELSAPSINISGYLDAQRTIENMANLSLLDFSYNQLIGDMPESIGKLTNLKVLMLNNNNFSGILPSTLSNCTRLRILNLRQNKFGGKLAAVDFSCLSELETLDLGFNNFSGTLPPTIYSCKSLVALRLSGNHLNGSVEPRLAELHSLSFISLSWNSMIGINTTLTILQEIKTLAVVLLDFNFNNESMPQRITGFANVRFFSVASSELQGQIPTWLHLMPKLAVVDLSNNNLRGSIPGWLGSLPSLFNLDLSNNSLSGEFPFNLTTLRSLISEIAFSEVNQSVLELPVFYEARRQYNKLYNLPPLLNLQQNNLTGVIPPEIGRLKMLQVLNLSYNSFSGNIPSEIANLDRLETLDLSSNRLVGKIPAELSKLHFLSKFNVAHNELSGPIPQGVQFSTFTISCFDGNSGLCAQNMAPLQPCNKTDQNSGQRYTRKGISKKLVLGLTLGICFVGVFVLVFLILIILSPRRSKQAEKSASQREAGVVSERSMPCFPQGDEIASCRPVVLFPENCHITKLTISEILNATNSFDKENIIGCGGFGLVYKCVLPDGTKLAIKRLIGDTGIMDREFKAEVEALSTARHENLVPLQGYFMHRNFRLLLYTLMENGSLDDWLHEKDDGPSVLNWPLRLLIAQGASQGLSYIHQTCKPHIVHRDIKSSNILLDHDLRAHIADFGLSRPILPTNTHVTTELVGTLGYIPPEYGQAWMATLRGDIYSFGVVLLELLTGRRPYDSFNQKEERELVGWVLEKRKLSRQQEVFDPLLKGHGNDDQMSRVLDIACLCVSQSPQKRPVIQDVVDWLHHVDYPREEEN